MNTQLLHNIFIALHVASAITCFVTGCILLFSRRNISIERWFGVYFGALVGLVVFLAGALVVNWTEYTGIQRTVFPGLFALATYMLYRAQRARRLLKDEQSDWKKRLVRHLGFTLISLFEGFIVVVGINFKLAAWLVILIAVGGAIGGVVLGRMAVRSARLNERMNERMNE